MRAAPPVQSRYGPTLPDLLGRYLRGVPPALRIGVPAVVLVVVLIAVGYKAFKGPGGTHLVVHDPITFNFRYEAPLHRVPPRAGELARIEARGKHNLFLSSFAVRPLPLPAHRGQSGAYLPAYATVHERSLAARFKNFRVVAEGRQRVVNEIAYAIFFTASLGDRHLSGRDVLLPDPSNARRGVELEMLSTPAGGAGIPASVAQSGPQSVPFHTFRFGTAGP
jgi:hypothetical protein